MSLVHNFKRTHSSGDWSVGFFPHKIQSKSFDLHSYQKGRQLSCNRLVEMLMNAENTARIFGFLNVKCVMERFTYFM